MDRLLHQTIRIDLKGESLRNRNEGSVSPEFTSGSSYAVTPPQKIAAEIYQDKQSKSDDCYREVDGAMTKKHLKHYQAVVINKLKYEGNPDCDFDLSELILLVYSPRIPPTTKVF